MIQRAVSRVATGDSVEELLGSCDPLSQSFLEVVRSASCRNVFGDGSADDLSDGLVIDGGYEVQLLRLVRAEADCHSFGRLHGPIMQPSCPGWQEAVVSWYRGINDQGGPMSDGHEHGHEFRIQIDRIHFVVHARSLTGAQLRQLPEMDIGSDRDLFEVVPGQSDRKIANDQAVEMHDGLRFFTAPGQINPGR